MSRSGEAKRLKLNSAAVGKKSLSEDEDDDEYEDEKAP
jgi:hypothetical protein